MQSINNERNYGIDLLRMIAMFMVTTLHVLGHGGVLASAPILSLNYEIAWLIETTAYCAVNCYALISGYVGIDSKYKFSNVLVLWLQVAVYSVGITLAVSLAFPGSVDARTMIRSFFPIMIGQYWYFTAYFGLFLFMPILNLAVHTIEKNHLKRFIRLLILMLSVCPTLFRNDVFKTSWGYNAFWFMFLYLVGAYLKKYGLAYKLTNKIYLILYVISIFVSWITKYWIEKNGYNTYLLISDGNLFVTYLSPTILLAAISLLLLFSQIKLNKYLINMVSLLSPAAFGVYLIHDHPLFREYIISNRFAAYASYSPAKLVIAVITTAAVIYICCLLVDLLRCQIFRILKIKQFITKKFQK